MRIEQPTFPLDNAAFSAALRTGHGRAVQQVDRYGTIGLSDAIVEACVSCQAYDPQCEEKRAPWLFSIVERSGLQPKILQAIDATIQNPPAEHHWDMDQRSDILKELAAAGSNDARLLLYSSLARLSRTEDVIGADQIVALDGEHGLMSVARQLGRWLQADPSFWVDDSLIWQFDAAMGIESGLMALEHEAKTDPDVASYIAGLRMTREIRNAASKIFDGTGYTGAEVVVHVRENPKDRCIWLPRWGMQADSEQRETVFAALLSCDEPKQIKRLLRCFQKKGVPRFDRRLLRWIDSSDQELRWAAVRAVAPTKHLELRQMAIRLISDGEIADGIALLVNNFEAGDFAFCARHLKLRDDPDEVHNLVGELLDLCEANPDSDALDCLLYVYEFSPCSICRGRAVKALMDKSTAPDWVQAEAAFDANPEIRTLVGAGVPPQ